MAHDFPTSKLALIYALSGNDKGSTKTVHLSCLTRDYKEYLNYYRLFKGAKSDEVPENRGVERALIGLLSENYPHLIRRLLEPRRIIESIRTVLSEEENMEVSDKIIDTIVTGLDKKGYDLKINGRVIGLSTFVDEELVDSAEDEDESDEEAPENDSETSGDSQ